jgi:hypothetical protein
MTHQGMGLEVSQRPQFPKNSRLRGPQNIPLLEEEILAVVELLPQSTAPHA